MTQNDSSSFSFQKLRVCCPHGRLLWGQRDIWSSRVLWLCPRLGDGVLCKKPQKTKASSTPTSYLSVNKKQVGVFWIMISESRISAYVTHIESSPGYPVVKTLPASAGDTGDVGFDSWIGQVPQKRKWQPTPVFLPGKCHWQKNLTSYSPWGHEELDMTKWLSTHIHTHPYYQKRHHTNLMICHKTRPREFTAMTILGGIQQQELLFKGNREYPQGHTSK